MHLKLLVSFNLENFDFDWCAQFGSITSLITHIYIYIYIYTNNI